MTAIGFLWGICGLGEGSPVYGHGGFGWVVVVTGGSEFKAFAVRLLLCLADVVIATTMPAITISATIPIAITNFGFRSLVGIGTSQI
ncbi:MAG TPA: hypothetical protein VMU77_03840 [Acidimicrobiales bacterium]|nr:hypothetical protein [Acidimicrobiales bacterium]